MYETESSEDMLLFDLSTCTVRNANCTKSADICVISTLFKVAERQFCAKCLFNFYRPVNKDIITIVKHYSIRWSDARYLHLDPCFSCDEGYELYPLNTCPKCTTETAVTVTIKKIGGKERENSQVLRAANTDDVAGR